MLHGTWASGAELAPISRVLDPDVDMMHPDLPGHGERWAEPYSLARSVDEVEDLVAAAGDRPVVLGGHSLGGYAAMTYAARRPHTVAGLVLMGCAVEPRGIGALAYKVVGRAVDVCGPHRIRAWRENRPYQAIAPLWNEVIDTCGVRQLEAVTAPVLFLGGRLDQLHIGARGFARATAAGTVVTQPKRWHDWPYTHPGEVAGAISTWLTAKGLAGLPVAA